MNNWRTFLYAFGNRWIFRIFYFFFGLAYLFSLLSSNLTLGDNSFFGTSTTLFLFLFLTGVVLIVALYYSVESVKKKLTFFFVQKQVITSTTLFLLVVFVQLVFVHFFHPTPGWDVDAIHMGLIHPENRDIQSYFSLNQNNLPILLVQVKLAELFGTTSWLFFDYVTLLLVDLAAVLGVLSATILEKNNYGKAMYLHSLLLLVFPWIVMPYTDTWVLPLLSGLLLAYSCSQTVANLWAKGLSWAFIALFSLGCYFIKPSTIIPFIAIVIIEGLYFLQQYNRLDKKRNLATSGIILLVCLVFVGGFKGVNGYLQGQTHISIDKTRGIPMIHFVNTGMSEDGAYDPEAALQMILLPTKKEKIAYSKEQINQRLETRGVFGYLSFLVEKHRQNTADGTFSWGKEGSFFKENPKPERKSGLTNLFKHTLFLYGDYIANFRFIAQLVWVGLLTCIFFGWKGKSKMEQMLRLSILGGFLFLLIFEGGRSRYLIQFLPVILLLSTVCVKNAREFFETSIRKILYPIEKKAKQN